MAPPQPLPPRCVLTFVLLLLLAPRTNSAAVGGGPPAVVQAPVGGLPRLELVPLTHVSEGLYTLALAVGTPQQRLRVMLDSWSSDLWLPSPSSLGANATVPHEAFNSSRSVSFRLHSNSSQRLPYPHAGNSTVDVEVGDDVGDVSGSLTRLPIIFGVASREDAYFLKSAGFDGMLGMALDSAAHIDGVLSTLANDTGRRNVFGLFLTLPWGANGSELAVGGYNAARFYRPDDDIIYTPVVGSESDCRGAGRVASSFLDVWRVEVPRLGLSRPRAGADEPSTLAAAAFAPQVNLCESGCVAVLDVAQGSVALPPPVYHGVVALVNLSCHGHCALVPDEPGEKRAREGAGLPPPRIILCLDNLVVMPNLTFTVLASIANTQATDAGKDAGNDAHYFDLPLLPSDYCLSEWSPPSVGALGRAPKGFCRLMLAEGPEVSSWRRAAAASPGPGAAARQLILLGTPFLRAFYTVFDSSAAPPDSPRVGFASVRADGVLPSSWQPPQPSPVPSGGGGDVNSWVGSKEMYAGIVGVGLGLLIAGGLFVVMRDRCREHESRRRKLGELLGDLEETGSIVLEDHDDDFDDAFDDEDVVTVSGSSAAGSRYAALEVTVRPTAEPPSS